MKSQRANSLLNMDLSTGFCLYCHHAEPLAAIDDMEVMQSQLWSCPVLQLLDIQCFTSDPNPAAPRRYYLALSDARHCIWAIAPPHSPIELAIDEGNLEVGCLVTLDHYCIVAAKCGKNVVVILSASYSSSSYSLIGDPLISNSLMVLSANSLLNRNLTKSSGPGALPHAGRYTERNFADFLPAEGGIVLADPLERWSLVGRVLWKSKLRNLYRPTTTTATAESSSTQHQHEGTKFVFDFVLVDGAGDAMKILCWNSKAHFETVEVGHCIRISDASVKRDAETHEPTIIQMAEKSMIDVLSTGEDDDDEGDEIKQRIPLHPSRLIGECAIPFLSVSDVLQHHSIGSVVSVEGAVVQTQPRAQIRTMRGTVDKCTITIKDSKTPQTIEVILWEGHARECTAKIGEVWCFRNVVIRVFGSTKQLSSRASSEIFEASAAFAEKRVLGSLYTTIPKKRPDNSLVVGNPTPGDAAVATAAASLRAVTFLHDLIDANQRESIFVLVKIQRIKVPLFYLACTNCGNQVKGIVCASCSSSQSELRFLVRMELADGLTVVDNAIGFTGVGEALFGESTAEFIRNAGAQGDYTKRAIDSVIGLPLLVNMIKCSDGIRHVMEIKHVDMAKASHELFAAIASYI